MNLVKATTLATLTLDVLNKAIVDSGYSDSKVVNILEVDVRELDVRYYVRFADPSDSFNGEDPVGNLFVSMKQYNDGSGEPGTYLHVEF